MQKKDLDKIIREYIEGKDTKEGKALFDQWYSSFKDESFQSLNEEERERIKAEMFARITHELQDGTHTVEANRSFYTRRTIYRIAASVIGILSVVFVYILATRFSPSNVEWTTENAEIQNIILPDGSQVVLNANSSLSYSHDWDEHAPREVQLTGEAFFSVIHTASDQKFTVYTPQLNISVLGTEFNVFHRRGETNVVLSNGKVDVSTLENKMDNVTMKPGERVEYSSGQPTIVKETVNPQIYTAWKNQEIILENTSIAEIAQTLEDYYGFDVIIRDEELKGQRITSLERLSMNDVDVIVEAISEILDITIIKKENKLYMER